ncbi:MAG: ABC transporter permease [Treponema sp.]|jgi:simple sugar transport system permease protein|nr:ABC transporter permease [Treponema sp.]
MPALDSSGAPAPLYKKLLKSRLLFSVALLFILVLQNIITTPDFFKITVTNGLVSGYIPNIIDQASTLVIVTLGMTLVTAVAGGQDISVGAIMAVAASFCGLLLNGSEYRTEVFHNPYYLALIAGLLGGALCGAFNGFMVAVLNIQPMIASLILFTSGRSIAKVITHGQTVYIMNPVYKYLGVQIPGLPVRTTIIVTVAMILLIGLIVKVTSFGLFIESIGINSSAARLVGLNSTAIKFITFIICGMLAGVAGLVGSSGVGSVNAGELGLGIELDAILAVALGGNMLGGGKFSIAGSVIGAYTIQAITTTLYTMSVRADQLYVFKAVIIILIIIVSSDVFKETVRRFYNKTGNISARMEG